MNKKKLALLITVVALMFMMSGCSLPVDENGKYILISLETTFDYMIENEGFFSAIFVYPLSQFINFVTPYTNVGVAILIVTVVINGIVLLLTLKQNVAMQKLQTIQPEAERIQRKYEGKTDERSKMRQAQEIQALYQKHNINPLASLVSTFVQFPILIAMYHAVIRSEAVATGKFMGVSLEVSPLVGIKEGQFIYIAFFVVMIISQFASSLLPQELAKYRAKQEAERQHRAYRPAANNTTSIMYVMLITISIVAVGWPTAMSFYWTISSLVNIVKALIIDQITSKSK
jgi:YidC/Oxa1 family membrane protein insertase